MPDYKPDLARTAEIIKKAGKVVVIGKPQVTNKDADGQKLRPEYIIAAVKGIWQAGLPAELTFRIPEAILKEAVPQLVQCRAELYEAGHPVALGIGSIAAISELETALEWRLDFVVAPSSGVGGTYQPHPHFNGQYRDPIVFVKLALAYNVFAAPAAFTPNEIAFYLFREDGNRPDALKIFNSELLAADNAKALGGLLAPFAREDGMFANKGYVIMPTGAVNRKTGPAFEHVITANGFFPVLGMSDPIECMKGAASADLAQYRAAVQQFLSDYALNKQAFLDKLAKPK
jgi:hypothetical protein